MFCLLVCWQTVIAYLYKHDIESFFLGIYAQNVVTPVKYIYDKMTSFKAKYSES